ncbi:hypothetical protein [Amycolatopsis sp.]|uniref:nSTAND3 domain-containing NTPase n=1 Tax=Amycolatopsis sp. TaxID=37632 RepID=UPI002DFD1E89|nr:hypothetical protein [Amycolatopsis sp.]
MTETLVTGAQGPVHAGSGNQYIVNGPGPDWKSLFRKAPPPRIIGTDFLKWLAPRFVEPKGYGEARDKLEDSGIVLLDGLPGSGRQTVATMLLHRSPDGRFHKLSDRPDDGESPVLDVDGLEKRDRLLLDLSESDEQTYLSIQRELPAYRVAINEKDARLVVVLPAASGYLLEPEFRSLVATTHRPDGSAVLLRYLKTAGTAYSPADLGTAEVKEILDRAPMREVAKLAELTNTGEGLKKAASALRDRAEDVAKMVKRLRLGRQRSMLLTVAMLSGAPADTIFEANTDLLVTLGHPIGRIPRLEQAGLGEELARIDAEIDSARRVRFDTPAYDEAVRTHFWDNFLDLREGFRSWVGKVIGANFLARENGTELVARFAEQALRTGRPYDLTKLAMKWAERTDQRSPSPSLLYSANALEAGLADNHHGVVFRERIYHWSTTRNLPGDLAQVLVEVCRKTLAQTHPERALVRLHHLSRLYDEAAAASAWAAVTDLVENDHRLYRRLLDRVARSAAKPDQIDLDLFLTLADPESLLSPEHPRIRDPFVRKHLSIGWAGVMARPIGQWRASAREWLTASEDEKYRELLLDILVAGGGGEPKPLSELYRVARDWAAGRSASRRPVFLRVAEKINIAQGIDSEGTAR